MAGRKKLKLGNSDFKSTIEEDAYYIDKTMMIKEVIESEHQVLLLTRPRRFGKTLNLSMLKYFFDIREPENKKLFEELGVWQSGNGIKEKQGKYPVIYLSFKDAKDNLWENSHNQILSEISDLYEKNNYTA